MERDGEWLEKRLRDGPKERGSSGWDDDWQEGQAQSPKPIDPPVDTGDAKDRGLAESVVLRAGGSAAQPKPPPNAGGRTPVPQRSDSRASDTTDAKRQSLIRSLPRSRPRFAAAVALGIAVLGVLAIAVLLVVVPTERESLGSECGRWNAFSGSDPVCQEGSIARAANFSGLVLFATLPALLLLRRERIRWSHLQRAALLLAGVGAATATFTTLDRELPNPSDCRPVDTAWFYDTRALSDACTVKSGVLLGAGAMAGSLAVAVFGTVALTYNRIRPGRGRLGLIEVPADVFDEIDSPRRTYVADGPGIREATGGFCPSCGTGAADGSAVCASCGWDLHAPAEPPGAEYVGALVRIRWRLRAHDCVVIAQDAGPEFEELTVLDSQHRTGRVDARLAEVQATRAEVSAGMRVLAAGPPWTEDVLLPYAVAVSARSNGAARVFAREALMAGAARTFQAAPISRTERAWLLLLQGLAQRQPDTVALALADLPRDGYPGKLTVFLRDRAFISATPELAAVVEEHLSPYRTSTLGRMTSFLVDPNWMESSDARRFVAANAADLLAAPQLQPARHARARARFFRAAEDPLDPPHRLFPELGDYARPLSFAWVARGGPVPSSVEREHLIWLAKTHPGLLDDLIEADLVDGRAGDLDSEPYFVGRIAIARLTDGDLDGLGAYREEARRAYIHNQQDRLEQLATCSGAGLYTALAAVERGQFAAAEEAAALADPSDREFAEAVVGLAAGKDVDHGTFRDRAFWPAVSAIFDAGLVGGESTSLPKPMRRTLLLRQSRAALFEWRWAESADHAQSVLGLSPPNEERTEALNLLACARYHDGRPSEAVAALRQALKHQDAAVMGNLATILLEVSPAEAVNELSEYATVHSSSPAGAEAARRALSTWWDEQRSGSSEELPRQLRAALRAVAAAGQKDLDHHVEVLEALRAFDRDWLGTAGHTAGSTQAGTPEHKVIIARAKGWEGWEDFANALAAGLRSKPQSTVLTDLRNEALTDVNELLGSEEHQIIGALATIDLLKAKVPLDDHIRAAMTALSLQLVLGEMQVGEDEPAEQIIQLAMAAPKLANEQVDDEDLAEALDRIANHCAILVAAYRQSLLEELLDAMRRVEANTQGFLDKVVNWVAARETKAAVRGEIATSLSILSMIESQIPDRELAQQTRELRSDFERLRAHLTTGF